LENKIILGLESFLKFNFLGIENHDIFGKVYYSYFEEQHLYLFYYIVISFFLTIILFLVAFILSSRDWTFEKVSPYECGFEPFGDGTLVFNIQFFVVGILFMIFDLELAYLFPWAINLGNLSLFGFFIMIFFLLLLVLGFVYEWKKGALDWL
jgi:NADH:ubiquinone oxidoreductase subunit 3 (subunit A)